MLVALESVVRSTLRRFPLMVRSTLLRLLLMGPLRANPGGPPASVAWTPFTQGFLYKINGFQKSLTLTLPIFDVDFRFSNDFSGVDRRYHHAGPIWVHFGVIFFRKIIEN